MSRIKNLWQVVKEAGAGFGRHKALKLCASLSFYTIFTIGPMMIIVIYISNLLWGSKAIEGKIFDQISGLIGDVAALKIQELIQNATISSNDFMAVIGVVVLVITATTIFIEIQDSMNTIWNLKIKKGTGRKGSGWLRMLRDRLVSFIFVVGLGFLLFVFLLINGILEGFTQLIQETFPSFAFVMVYAINLTLTMIVVALLFAFIYKVLPDAKIQWKDVGVGAFFAAILFMIGKQSITFYINNSNFGNTYNPAGSMIILLLWVYYSSIILYYGAEFTKAYAMKFGSEIMPKDYAVSFQLIEKESEEIVHETESKTSEIKKSQGKGTVKDRSKKTIK